MECAGQRRLTARGSVVVCRSVVASSTSIVVPRLSRCSWRCVVTLKYSEIGLVDAICLALF